MQCKSVILEMEVISRKEGYKGVELRWVYKPVRVV